MVFEGPIFSNRQKVGLYEKLLSKERFAVEMFVIPKERHRQGWFTSTVVLLNEGQTPPSESPPKLPQPPRESRVGRIATMFLTPLMKFLAGTNERAQETHPWNVKDYKPQSLNKDFLVAVSGTYSGWINAITPYVPSWLSATLAHAPIVGGWRDYVVLEAQNNVGGDWHIGWRTGGTTNISTIPLSEARVRMLTGPEGNTTQFFAVSASGEQLPLREVGRGSIGDGGEFKNIRLL